MPAPAPEDVYIAPVSAVIGAPAPVDEHAARVYATSAQVAEYSRRRQPDRGASASGRVQSAVRYPC